MNNHVALKIPFRAVMALKGFLSGLSWPCLPWAPSINATHLLMAPMAFFQAETVKMAIATAKG